MKDILEALVTRVKSPVYGYIFFSWFAINWREFILLLFSEEKLLERISTFDTSTDIYTLLVYPFGIGAVLAIISPWIKYPFLWFAVKPNELRNNLQIGAEHKTHLKKARLEVELIKVKQEADEELSKIKDTDLKAEIKEDIKDIRSKSSSNSGYVNIKLIYQGEEYDVEVDSSLSPEIAIDSIVANLALEGNYNLVPLDSFSLTEGSRWELVEAAPLQKIKSIRKSG